jgi:hypothetical protein
MTKKYFDGIFKHWKRQDWILVGINLFMLVPVCIIWALSIEGNIWLVFKMSMAILLPIVASLFILASRYR